MIVSGRIGETSESVVEWSGGVRVGGGAARFGFKHRLAGASTVAGQQESVRSRDRLSSEGQMGWVGDRAQAKMGSIK